MARKRISDFLQGGMTGAAAAAPASGGNPWIIGGGAALGAFSSLLGESETKADRLSYLLSEEQLKGLRMSNEGKAREMAKEKKAERNKMAVGSMLGNFMRGASIARRPL
jgi:hypothetical protein